MWPNNIIGKVLGNNNFVADIPNSTETMFETSNSSQTTPSSNKYAYKIFVGSWNVGGVEPPDDLDMEDWLSTLSNSPDIYVLGFQEIVPLNAGNILGCNNSRICMKWNSLIRAALNKIEPMAGEFLERNAERDQVFVTSSRQQCFDCIISKQMVGIFITVWVRNDLLHHIHHPNVSCVGCGIMGCLGNKGSVSVRFWLHETSFCFVCSHLASGGKEGDEKLRNANANEILSRTRFSSGPLRNLRRKILDHDQIVWLGDLNYRIYLPENITRSLVQRREWKPLLENDQLMAELLEGHVFQGWHEGVIEFAPTYKYCPNSGVYYGCDELKRNGKKRRAPAWCDRIIWFGEGLRQIQYNRGECRLSDHRPVWAVFTAEVKVLHNFQRSFVWKPPIQTNFLVNACYNELRIN